MPEPPGKWVMCPYGCGCRMATEDPDRLDCACDGPCCYDCRENGYPDRPPWAELKAILERPDGL